MPEQNKNWALALHGGAGAVAGRDYAETEAHLAELAALCRERLVAGTPALDVVEFAVAELESCGLYVAGRGSAPNTAGHVELDASIMNGATREAGAVAALQDFANPVCVARGVMEKTPHVMLAGAGAVEFAREHDFEEVEDPASYYTLPVGVTSDDVSDIAHGTVGAVAMDTSGGLAAATSTGGTFGKLHGRIGDTPLIGPGTWADEQIAVSCTGIGEHIIRAGGAAAISVLTEPSRFDGSLEHLEEVAAAVPGTPVMRKDFLVDPVQILEARSAGASGVLLIAAMLDDRQLRAMLDCAAEHGMFVLLESFDEVDLARSSGLLDNPADRERAGAGQLLFGVNTRNLRTLHVDPERLEKLAPALPAGRCVAESGLHNETDAAAVADLGYRLALVGTALMRSADPAGLVAAMRDAGKARCVT